MGRVRRGDPGPQQPAHAQHPVPRVGDDAGPVAGGTARSLRHVAGRCRRRRRGWMSRRAGFAVLAAVLLVLAACGDDTATGDGEGSDPSETSTETRDTFAETSDSADQAVADEGPPPDVDAPDSLGPLRGRPHVVRGRGRRSRRQVDSRRCLVPGRPGDGRGRCPRRTCRWLPASASSPRWRSRTHRSPSAPTSPSSSSRTATRASTPSRWI